MPIRSPSARADEPDEPPQSVILWDDEGFRSRITELAQLRGESVREVLLGAGASTKYMDPAAAGRNTNVAMKVAKYLAVHPAYLMFGPTIATAINPQPFPDFSSLPSNVAAGATCEQRLAIISQIVASHWLHLAIDPGSAPPTAEAKLRQIVSISTRQI